MRKTLLVVALLAACGKKGSEPKAGDCGASIDKAMELSKEDYKKSNVADTTLPKIREAALARCTEDKWSNDVHTCLVAAKSSQDVIKCQSKMTKEQQENLGKAITAVMQAAQPSGSDTGSGDQGSGSDTGSAGSAGSGSAEAGSGSAAPTAALPAECAEYKTMVEKLMTCDKYPAASRDAMKKGFEATSKAWEGFDKLPPDSKKAMAEACKTAAATLKTGASGCAL